MVNCLVTGVGSLIGQGIIKALKESSLPCRIVGTDYFDHAVGLYWLDRGYILPDLLDKNIREDVWVERMVDILKSEKIDIVLVGLDFEVDVLARHKEQIETATGAKVIVGDPAAVDICKDKWKTSRFLQDNDFPYPDSCLPEDREAFLSEHDFPLVVKPRFGFRSRNLFIVRNRLELEDAVAKCPRPVIQELVGGPDEEYTCGCLTVKGEIISTIVLKRYLKDGNTARAIFTEDCLSLNDFVNRVASLLKLEGPANYQLRRSAKGPVIFEINPRFSGTTPVRVKFGTNEVEILIRAVLFGEMSKQSAPRPGVVMRYFEDQYVPLEEFQKWAKP